jgi:hypothetical protein
MLENVGPSAIPVADGRPALHRATQVDSPGTSPVRKPLLTKHQWLEARIADRVRAGYTGRVVYVVDWNHGGISRIREEVFVAGSSC